MYWNVVTTMSPHWNGQTETTQTKITQTETAQIETAQTETARPKHPVPAGATSLEGLGKPNNQQQFQIVLLAPHQDETKRGRWWSHATWCLDDIWVTFPWL